MRCPMCSSQRSATAAVWVTSVGWQSPIYLIVSTTSCESTRKGHEGSTAYQMTGSHASTAISEPTASASVTAATSTGRFYFVGVPTKVLDEAAIECAECGRSVDEFTAIHERWGYWSDGCGELVPFCAECAKREFAPDARASGLVPLVRRRPA